MMLPPITAVATKLKRPERRVEDGDSVEVDENGNLIGGYTQFEPEKLHW